MPTDPTRVLDLRFFGFDAAGNIVDRSGYGFDMNPNADAGDDSEFVDGQHGQAWSNIPNKYFNYLLQAGDALDFQYGFTYEAWLRRTGNFGVTQAIMGKTTGNLLTNVSATLVFVAANTVRIEVGDGTGWQIGTSISTIIDTNIHHIVVTYDMANARFYIDGELDNTVNIPYGFLKSCAGSNFEIGRYPNVAGQYSNIEYEVIRVFNRVYGASEARSNFMKGPNRT